MFRLYENGRKVAEGDAKVVYEWLDARYGMDMDKEEWGKVLADYWLDRNHMWIEPYNLGILEDKDGDAAELKVMFVL